MSKEREEGGRTLPARNQADTQPYRTQDERPDYTGRESGNTGSIQTVTPEPDTTVPATNPETKS